jgi:molybdate transport system substrate-binding protein
MVEIKVLSSLATKEAYLELVPIFERAAGHKVATTWAGTADIVKRLAAGETYDLIIISSTSLAELIKQGKVAADSRVELARTGIGIAVRAGAPKPDIGSGAAVKKALLAAKTVGYSTGPSGVYLAGLFERMGIAAEIKAKTRQVPSGGTVCTIIASGEAEIGFQQVSELVHVPGVDFVGPLPPDVQHVTVFSCGIQTGAKNQDAARELVWFLTVQANHPVFKKHGLEVGASGER